MAISDLPALNATLNGIAAILLVYGYTLIRRGEQEQLAHACLGALQRPIGQVPARDQASEAVRHEHDPRVRAVTVLDLGMKPVRDQLNPRNGPKWTPQPVAGR